MQTSLKIRVNKSRLYGKKLTAGNIVKLWDVEKILIS